MRSFIEGFVHFGKSVPCQTCETTSLQEPFLPFKKETALFFCSDSAIYNSRSTTQRNTHLWWCQYLVLSHSWDFGENNFLGMYSMCRWLAFVAASCISKYFPLWGSGWNCQCDRNASYKKIKVAMFCNSIIHWNVAGACWKKKVHAIYKTLKILLHYSCHKDCNENGKWHKRNPFSLQSLDCNLVLSFSREC